MATVTISDTAKGLAEALVRSGRYRDLDQAVEAGLRRLHDQAEDEEVDLDDLSPELRAAVEQGLGDIEAGRVHDGDEVFAELRERIRNCAS